MQELELPPNRDLFFRHMIREFAGALEDTVGLDEAEGYINIVGSQVGNWIEEQYKAAAGKQRFSPEEVADLLVDLKRRIGGDFSVASVDDAKIVLTNNACPFGELVEGRPSLCHMTSSVFGRIAADQFGYARVTLPEAIAQGHTGCKVVVHLKQTDESEQRGGREFFRVEESLLEDQ